MAPRVKEALKWFMPRLLDKDWKASKIWFTPDQAPIVRVFSDASGDPDKGWGANVGPWAVLGAFPPHLATKSIAFKELTANFVIASVLAPLMTHAVLLHMSDNAGNCFSLSKGTSKVEDCNELLRAVMHTEQIFSYDALPRWISRSLNTFADRLVAQVPLLQQWWQGDMDAVWIHKPSRRMFASKIAWPQNAL